MSAYLNDNDFIQVSVLGRNKHFDERCEGYWISRDDYDRLRDCKGKDTHPFRILKSDVVFYWSADLVMIGIGTWYRGPMDIVVDKFVTERDYQYYKQTGEWLTWENTFGKKEKKTKIN